MNSPHLPLFTSLAFALAVTAQAGDLSTETTDQAYPQLPAGSLSVAELLSAPIVDDTAEPGTVWARGRNQRLHFEDGVIEVLPIFGSASPHEWPIQVAVTGATIGGDFMLDVSPTGAPTVRGNDIVQRRGAFSGVHHLGLNGFEQTYVFNQLPVRGELSVQLGVETELEALVDGKALSFVHPTLGRVDVGTATAVDGAGRRTAVERRWTGSGIELIVPASFVESATLPLTIDPVWRTFATNHGIPDDGNPDVVFAGESQRYVIVWEELTSQTNRDVYAISFDEDLENPSNVLAVDLTSSDWTEPAVAYTNANDHVLVAAVRGASALVKSVAARRIDVGPFTLPAPSFTVSSVGTRNISSVDIGGSNSLFPFQDHFAVVWSREISPSNGNIEHRVVHSDGTFVGPTEIVDSSLANDIQCAISQGLGDTALPGDNWHLVWIREGQTPGRGDLWAKRLNFNGTDGSSSDPFLVEGVGDFAHPDVSSLFDEADAFTGSRNAMVVAEAFKFDNLRPDGFRTDIEARLISNDDDNGSDILITTMEDVEQGLLQARPRIAIDGKSFYITYLEEEPTMINGGTWNVYMATGNTVETNLRTGAALAERHLLLAEGQESEDHVDITSRWLGERDSTSNEGVAIWTVLDPMIAGEYGAIEGAGFRFLLGGGVPVQAVGVQYGAALLTTPQDAATGWMRLIGTQSRNVPPIAQAIDLPTNVFGFMLASREPGVVNNPGGSAGRLLLGGQVGRYVNQIASSGSAGRMSFTIDPFAIPVGNGTDAALVNETWHFQVWHRDIANGVATSNLTNAVRITFRN